MATHSGRSVYIAELLVPDVKIRQEKIGALTRIEIDGIAHAAPAGVASRAAPSIGVGHNAPKAPPMPEPAKPLLSMAAEVAAAVPAGWGAPVRTKPVAAAAAAPPRSDPNEEVIVLRAGCLSRALPPQMQDFRTDMKQLGEFVNCAVRVDATQDRLVLNGGPREREEARKELEQILAFYQWSLS